MRIRLPGRTFVLASIGVALLATSAVAGSGVGGVFNLGQTNTVDVRTLLQGNTNVQLHVVNQSTAAGLLGSRGKRVRVQLSPAHCVASVLHGAARAPPELLGSERYSMQHAATHHPQFVPSPKPIKSIILLRKMMVAEEGLEPPTRGL